MGMMTSMMTSRTTNTGVRIASLFVISDLSQKCLKHKCLLFLPVIFQTVTVQMTLERSPIPLQASSIKETHFSIPNIPLSRHKW